MIGSVVVVQNTVARAGQHLHPPNTPSTRREWAPSTKAGGAEVASAAVTVANRVAGRSGSSASAAGSKAGDSRNRDAHERTSASARPRYRCLRTWDGDALGGQLHVRHKVLAVKAVDAESQHAGAGAQRGD